MATLTSRLIISLIDHVTAPARAITARIDRLTAASRVNAARLSAVRGQMLGAAGAGYALYRGLSAPIKAATDFETKLEDIAQKIDAPISALPKLGAEIRKIGQQTTQSATEIAEGMDILAGMGASAQDALGLLPAIGRAATAYNASIADLSQAGYAALSNLKVPANEFAKALDAMAQAGKDGAFELRDMAQYFPELGAAYQGLGQKGVPAVADLSAALQIVRKGTGDSASAATNLNNILQKIYAPRTVKAFGKMGVDLRRSMARAAKAGMTPIEAIAEITSRTLKGDLSRLGDLFQDAQVQKGLRPLIQNMKEYRKIRADAMAASGVVEKDYEQRLLTAAKATERWKIAIENLNLAIGAALLPALTQIVNKITPIINGVSTLAAKYPELTRTIIMVVSALVSFRIAVIAARFAGLFLKGAILDIALASLRSARFILGLLNPIKLVTAAFRVLKLAVIGTGIGAIVVGIALAGTWIYENWSGIAEMFRSFGKAFMAALGPVRPILDPVINGIKMLFNWVTDLLGPIDQTGEGWRNAGQAAGEFVGNVVRDIIELPGKISALASQFVQSGKDLMNALWDGIKQIMAQIVGYIKSSITGAFKSVKSTASSWANTLSFGLIGSAKSPAVAGARAAGGPVRAGLPYLVGERGPEVVTFARNAFVNSAVDTARMMRNAALATAVAVPAAVAPAAAAQATNSRAGAPVINLTIQATTNANAQEIAQEVKHVLSRELDELYNGAFHDGVN